ncbi:MAG TPA: ABATE domain-containing protein [Gaiella sp.]|nr:ABATE domain-containing protein [Gaiella sp.]
MTDEFQPGGRLPAPQPLRLVQDFVNTEIPDFGQDDIATPEELAAWLAAHGLARPSDAVDAALFVEARALRSALRELALANTLETPPAPARRKAIDATLRGFPLVLRLVDERPRLVPSPAGARGGLATLVAVLAEARAAGTWERLKACRQETCGWVFYDGSRNRSSSWCSMQVCGGRAKASSYRRRRATRQSRRSRR